VVKFLPAGRQGYTRTIILVMEYFVYILKSLKNGSYYKGISKDLELRLRQHNNGLTSGNKLSRPFILVFVQICDSLIEARHLEEYLKSGSGREIIPELI
jgi:putative endonuclease